jgi:glycopeptide antibiotics resistance protein
MDVERSINLIPFGAMLHLNGRPSYNEIIYNGLAFLPFGIYISMLSMKKSFMHLIVPLILTSLLFEIMQYVFALGASDITDVIANTFGGIIGIGLFFSFQKICRENTYKVMNVIALVLTIALALFIGAIWIL